MPLSDIFPKNEHMKVGIYALSTIGVWPLKFTKYPKLGKIYTIWSNFLYYYFLSFVLRQFIELIRQIYQRNVIRIVQNCSLTLLTAISAVRSGVVRGELIQNLSAAVIQAEERIFRTADDPEVVEIYRRNVRMSQWANLFFIFVGTVTATPFYFGPIAERHAYPENYRYDNETGKIPSLRLPLSTWVPYDYTQHYLISFLWQIADGWSAECFVVYTDAFLFGMMIFPVGQMKILQHILKNFRKYAKKTQKYGKISKYDEAAFATIRSCILYHKEIIDYVEQLNRSMRLLMLLDFASCSVQMSIIVFQVIMSDINVPMLFAVEFLIAMVIQLFLFYWNANEILVESVNVAQSIGQSDWYMESEEVKKCLQMIMLRSQKPLTLKIGSFYPMSTDTAISILKATYSYAMLLRQSYTRRL